MPVQFSVYRKDFSDALADLAVVVGANKAARVRVAATDHTEIVLSTPNYSAFGEVIACVTLAAEMPPSGVADANVGLKELRDAVRKMSNTSRTLKVVFGPGEKIVVSDGVSSASVQTGPSLDAFPLRRISPTDGNARQCDSRIVDAMQFILPSVSKDSTRYILNGIHFDHEKNSEKTSRPFFTMVGTDGHRMHVIRQDGLSPFGAQNLTLSWVAGEFLLRRMGRDKYAPRGFEVAPLKGAEGRFVLEFRAGGLSSLVIVGGDIGRYPDWRQVTPDHDPVKRDDDTWASMSSVRAFIEAVKPHAKNSMIRLSFDPARASVDIVSRPDGGESEDKVMTELPLVARPLAAREKIVAVNPQYIMDMLEAMRRDLGIAVGGGVCGGLVTISFLDEFSPILLHPAARDDVVCLCMPMRI